MKQRIFFCLGLVIIAAVSEAQDITVTGVVSKSISADKIILVEANIQFTKDVILSCDQLVIDHTVTALQITGNVKIVCTQIISFPGTQPTIQLTNSKGLFTIIKPQNQVNLQFALNNSPQLEIRCLDSE